MKSLSSVNFILLFLGLMMFMIYVSTRFAGRGHGDRHQDQCERSVGRRMQGQERPFPLHPCPPVRPTTPRGWELRDHICSSTRSLPAGPCYTVWLFDPGPPHHRPLPSLGKLWVQMAWRHPPAPHTTSVFSSQRSKSSPPDHTPHRITTCATILCSHTYTICQSKYQHFHFRWRYSVHRLETFFPKTFAVDSMEVGEKGKWSIFWFSGGERQQYL